MKYYLVKTEPSKYSIDDLQKEDVASWDGVTHPQAVRFLKAMAPGDRVFIYHSGGEDPGIVGLAGVVGNSRPDLDNLRSWLVDFKFIEKFDKPVTLKEMQSSGRWQSLRLIRQPRLSTTDLPDEFVEWLKEKGLDFSI